MARPTTASRQRDSQEGPAYGLAYYRVSTSRQANTSFDEDGFSIRAQRDYCQRKAADMGVQLIDEYIDRGKSARTAGRPALQAMLARIKEDTDIQYVFVHKLDRLARNREDDVQIGLLLAKNGVRLVSCTENIDNTPSGRLVHGIMADIAEWYSANLSQEAKKGMVKKAEVGGTPGLAPLGYVNTRLKITELGKDIGVVAVDEKYAPIITECFKLYDSGRCTLTEVTAHANDQGLRLPANKRLPERQLARQNMQRILRNRYYTGWLRFNGVEYRGTHPALIDDATFGRVQALLTARNLNKEKGQKRPHHLKGFLFCAQCGRRFGVTVVTKRRSSRTYAYFYCLGRQLSTNTCQQVHVPIGDLEDAVRAYWAKVRIPTERIQVLRQAILESFTGKHEQGKVEIEQQKRRITELEQRRKKAKEAYFAEVLSLDEFKAEQKIVRQGIQAAEAVIAEWSVELESITQALDAALALVENPQVLYDALPEGLKVMLMQAVFAKLWILDSAVVGSDLTEPFSELLTLEVRLALAEQQRAAQNKATGRDKDATYYRMRETVSTLLRDWGPSWERPYVERPYGTLPIDKRNPGRQRAQGSNLQHLVHLMRHNSNSELVEWLRKHPHLKSRSSKGRLPVVYRATKWRIRDRLTEKDIVRLIMAFKTGMVTMALAERYGMNVKSVRKVVREHGVDGRPKWNKPL
jgi:site-specific DNA recombinase